MGKSEPEMWEELEAGAGFCTAVESVAGYRLPRDLDHALARPMLICIGASKNPSIAPATESETWAKVAKHIEEVRQSLSAMHYHSGNVRRMEAQLDQIVQKHAPRTPMARGGHWNPNVTNRLTFEYHAFVLVAVRCLSHVAFLVGRVFGRTCPNLKSLRSALDARAKAGHGGTAELLRILLTHEPHLTQMFSDETRKSIRDQIAHESFLPAGSLQIIGGKVSLLGILETSSGCRIARTRYRLSEVMHRQLRQLEALIRETLGALEGHCLPRIR